MSKRRNLLSHFGFTKKSKTNVSVEQQEAGSSADDAFLRPTDTTAAPAGKPAACESYPLVSTIASQQEGLIPRCMGGFSPGTPYTRQTCM